MFQRIYKLAPEILKPGITAIPFLITTIIIATSVIILIKEVVLWIPNISQWVNICFKSTIKTLEWHWNIFVTELESLFAFGLFLLGYFATLKVLQYNLLPLNMV